jgi:hypothetical protein
MTIDADLGQDLDRDEVARLAHLQVMAFWAEHTRWSPTGEMAEQDGVLLYATGSMLPVTFNGVFRFDDRVPGGEVLARADAWFGARGRGYTVHVRVEPDEDADLRDACAEAGLDQVGESEPEMVCRAPVAEPALPDGVSIRRLTTAHDVADFIAVSGEAYGDYGMPAEEAGAAINDPIRLLAAPHVAAFVARDADGPIAAAMTMVGQGIAGIYWVGTVRRARGRGVGEAVAAAATNAGFALGARFNTLQASPMGAPIYRRMGYEQIYSYAQLIRWTPPT